MFMLCVSSCFSATEEEEQAQSKKALKKQQKEAEKAAKKAEKQAKLVSVVVSFFALLFHIRRPLIQLVRLWRGDLLGIVGPRGYVRQLGGKSIHCLSIPVILAVFMFTQTKCYFLLHWAHNHFT